MLYRNFPVSTILHFLLVHDIIFRDFQVLCGRYYQSFWVYITTLHLYVKSTKFEFWVDGHKMSSILAIWYEIVKNIIPKIPESLFTFHGHKIISFESVGRNICGLLSWWLYTFCIGWTGYIKGLSYIVHHVYCTPASRLDVYGTQNTRRVLKSTDM